VPGTRASTRRPGDAAAVAILVALPVIVFGVPALLGHSVLPGDDLTQNLPLRVLAGRQIRLGQLPLYNPYIWSGAPLLADWNAGAAYPLTLLFAIVPGTAAWTLNMIVTWAAAAVGMFVFLRALRLASLPSALGALSFAFAGAMSAQVAHFGLVAGMSWVPVQLLAVLRLTEAEARSAASRLRWTGVLAAAFGLTILAGEPRAIDDAVVIVVIYAAWRIIRLGRRLGPPAAPVVAGPLPVVAGPVPVVAGPVRVVAGLVSVVAGMVLGACLGAVQWMPGLAAVGASQRGAGSVAFFNSGSLPHRWLLLMLVPDLMGGSGSFGQPAFFANYNLAEVTGYVGILPLVAAAVLLGRIRVRPRLPEWAVWHLMALAGVVLALGGNTPFGSLLVHLPLFGGQRLQSRNILVADLALAVLFAYWADHPFSERSHRFLGQQTRWFLGQGSQQLPSQGSQQLPSQGSQQFPGEKSQRFLAGRSQRFLGGRRQQTRRAPPGRRMDLETVLGVVPPLAVIAVVVLGLVWGAGLLHWLRAGPGAAGVDGRLKPWLVPYAVLGAGAVAFVIFGRRLRPGPRSRWLAGLVAIDLVVFTLLGVVAALPGLAGSADATARNGTGVDATARSGTGVDATARSGTGATATSIPPGRRGDRTAARAPARPIAALGYPGRFAIYDPDLLDAHELRLLGSPDLNVIGAAPSVQGYSSTVDGHYASATGSHQAMGEGQNVLDPGAVGDGTLDQLGTSILLTPPAYLITAARGSGPAPGPPGTGQRDVAAGHQATWYLATPLDVSRLEMPDPDARQDAAAGTRIGLMTPAGPIRWFPASAASASLLAISPPHPVTSVAVVAGARGPRHLGPPSVADPGGNVVVANGQLQDALTPPRWGYAGHDGSFAVFADHFARGPLSLQALPGRSTSGASVRQVGSAAVPNAAAVSSPHGVRVLRSVAAIAGWSATWHPRRGRPATLAVSRAGLVQAVDVPPGSGVVTWRYVPPWFTAGLALSLGATALILLLVVGGTVADGTLGGGTGHGRLRPLSRRGTGSPGDRAAPRQRSFSQNAAGSGSSG